MRIAWGIVLCLPLVGQDDPERYAAELDRIAERTRKIREALPRQSFYLDALAKGKDAKALFEFVRDRIAFEPYEGFMRGAGGTLQSRRGNSADKALLLAVLLSKIGVKAKLVCASIDAERLPKPAWPELAKEPAPDLGVDASRAKVYVAEAEARRQKFLGRLWTRFERDHAAILGALKPVEAPQIELELPDSHWFVRTPDGDLDPTLGKPATAEGEEHELSHLPDDHVHRLAVRIKIKKGDEEIVLLDATFRVMDLYGEVLAIANVPVDGAEKLAALENPTQKQILDTLAATTQFQPQIVTPSKTVAGHPFDLKGNKLPMREGRIEAVQDLGKGLGGLLGGMEKKEDKGELTANWIELETRGVTIKRTVFEKPTSGRQRAFDLLATREILVLPGELSESFVTDRVLSYAEAYCDYAKRQLRGGIPEVTLESYKRQPHLNETLYSFALARQTELRRLIDARFKGTTPVQPRTALVSYVRRFVEGSSVILGIDILQNDLVAPGKGWDGNLPLAAGILDTALEHEVNASPGDHANASVALERALLDNAAPTCSDSDESAILVVIPGKRKAFYRIDRMTGMALGYVDGGGQDLAEYAEVADTVIQLHDAMKFYADLFKCIALGLTVPLSGGVHDFQKCMWNLICGKILDGATAHIDIDTNWTNIIATKTISEMWSSLCDELANEAGLGK